MPIMENVALPSLLKHIFRMKLPIINGAAYNT